MQGVIAVAPVSNVRLWSGRILSGLAVSFLLFDGVIKLLQLAPVEASFVRLGYPVAIAPFIGGVELACLAAYANRRTAFVGAVLLSGYLGGAIATHLRIGDPMFTHVLFPSYVAMAIWGGLFLREDRLRALIRFEPRTAHPR